MADETRHDEQEHDEGAVFDRQYDVYREAYEQRGMSGREADQEAAEHLETAEGERAGAHRDRD